MSWAPELEAWPVAAMGSTDMPETTSQITDHRQLTVRRWPTAATTANSAAQRHDEATSICSTATSHWAGARVADSGRPETSESVSGMRRAAQNAHAVLAQAETRCERYPSTSRVRSFCGGVRNVAKKAVPTATAQRSSPAARSAGRPAVVSTPGSGMPSSSSERPVDIPDSGIATPAATRASTPTTGRARRRREPVA